MLRRISGGLLSVLCVCALWQLLSVFIHSKLILPGILDTARAFVRVVASADFLLSLGCTFARCFCALFFTVAFGFLIGSAAGTSDFFRDFIRIPLWIVKATPVVSLILLAVFWLTSSQIPVFVAFLIALPVFSSAVQKGWRSADKKLLEAADFYALSKAQKWYAVRLPCLKPFLKEGLSSSYGLIWKAVAAGEVLSMPRKGLGALLVMYQVHLETASLISVTLALVAAGVVSEALFKLIFKSLSLLRKKQNLSSCWFSAKSGIVQKEAEIDIKNVSVHYDSLCVLEDFSFYAKASSVTALVAKSGSGKSTLLTAIARDFCERNVPVSYVFQESRLFPDLTIEENVCFPLCRFFTREEALKRADYFLEKTGLLECKSRLPTEISGGERQRAALAQAFAYPSGVLLMDEAFQSQDVALETQLLELLDSLQKEERRTVVFATHDIREAVALSDSVLIYKGTPFVLKQSVQLKEKKLSSPELYISPDEESINAEKKIMRLLLEK